MQIFRAFQFHKRSQTVSGVAEEAYLRTDISCGSEACSICQHGLPALSAEAAHYVIPDAQALDNCLEIFELPQLQNIVLLTSVLQKVQARITQRPHAHASAVHTIHSQHHTMQNPF